MLRTDNTYYNDCSMSKAFSLYSKQLLKALVVIIAAGVFVLWAHVNDSFALQFNKDSIVKYTQNRYGQKVVGRLNAWFNMLDKVNTLPERQQLTEINNYWNFNIRGGEDIHIWGKTDYWATPLETISKGAGDCEDFVIAKYFSLVHSGVSPDKLRFIYVKANVGGVSIAHMVLGFYETPNAEPLILDNLSGSITPASRRPDLRPVFSFNANGVYVPGAQARSVDRIGHWRDLLGRMQNEGFAP